jgi:hypothetical protein
MDLDEDELSYHCAKRLTVLKLSLQVLARERELSERQQRIVRYALRATDGLIIDLLATSHDKSPEDRDDRA